MSTQENNVPRLRTGPRPDDGSPALRAADTMPADAAPDDAMPADAAFAIFERVQQEVVGRRREVREIFAAILSRKHILLEGPPGTSKSTIVRSIARSMNVPFHFIEGSIDLTPGKLLGYFNPGKVLKDTYQREYFEMGPLTLAMEEGVINIPRFGQVTARDGFTIICSQNPYDDVGTLQVSRAFLDRVVRVRMDYQSEDEEIAIVKLRAGIDDHQLAKTATRITRLTREAHEIKLGASVRAAIDIVVIVKNLTLLTDGDLRMEDFAAACKMALSSKVWLSETVNATPEEVIDRVIEKARAELGHEFYLGLGGDKRKAL